MVRALGGTIVVPPEWDGVWDLTDSTYDCNDVPMGVSTDRDTICGGQVYDSGGDGGPYALDCTGTVTATTLDITCTGSGEVFPDCNAVIDMHITGTRTGDNSRTVIIINTTYSGTAKGCDLLPPNCTQLVTIGTRIGPAPSDFCTTPARTTTWGKLKTLYR